MLAQDEAFARIRLLRSPNIGPVSYRQLLRRFGTASAALAALPDLAARGGSPYRAATEARVSTEIAAARAAGARYLFHDSADYPAALAALDTAPPILIYRGDTALGARPAVAIVGDGALALALVAQGEVAAPGCRTQRRQKSRCSAAISSSTAGTGPTTRSAFWPRVKTSRQGRSSVGFSAWSPVTCNNCRSARP